MALAPLSDVNAGRIRHPDGKSRSPVTAQRASGGNSGEDDPAAAGALGLDPGRRQAPALDHRCASHPGSRPCRGNAAAEPPLLRSSKRLPGTSVSLPGITLSDEGAGERARTRRSGANPGRSTWPSVPHRTGISVAGDRTPNCRPNRPRYGDQRPPVGVPLLIRSW